MQDSMSVNAEVRVTIPQLYWAEQADNGQKEDSYAVSEWQQQ